MKRLPKIDLTSRASSDLERQVAFIAAQVWGDPETRRLDILAAFDDIRRAPLASPVCKWVPETGVGLRRYHVGQFGPDDTPRVWEGTSHHT